MQEYRPTWKAYPKEYTPSLAATIKKDLKSEYIVIKPVNSAHSNGVIMVHKKELDNLLRTLFNKKQPMRSNVRRNDNYLNHCPGLSQTHNYWSNDWNDAFIAESMEASNVLLVDNKRYDPTMRVVFILTHDTKNIYLTILGGYWETPPADLDHPTASLTEKHRTVAEDAGTIAGLPINPKDFKQVKKMLKKFLIPLYTTMLEQWGLDSKA